MRVFPNGGLVRAVAAAVLLLTAQFTAALEQEGRSVLVVVNGEQEDSIALGEYYAGRRGVPPQQIVRLVLPGRETLTREEYERLVERPLTRWFAEQSAQDRILFIVLVKGIPLRIDGSAGRGGTAASVDSELTLLYQRMMGRLSPLGGPVANPVFAGTRDPLKLEPFSRTASDIYLVTRLDGFSTADVRGLIDRSLNASSARPSGAVVLDARGTDDLLEARLKQAAERLKVLRPDLPVVLEATAEAARIGAPAVGYFSWGSTDPALQSRQVRLSFAPGAIGARYLSTDARTFTEPPPEWTPGSWNSRSAAYAGSPESLAGDLIREGITGLAGQVAEAYGDSAVRPDVLFPAYAGGYSLAEAFYFALPSLSWQTVVIGDPLCRPFGEAGPAPGDAALDAETELPGIFAARRLDVLTRGMSGARPDAVKLVLLAESRQRRGNVPGMMEALERAIALEPRLAAASLLLATAYDSAGAYDKAEERYRQVLAAVPNDVVALNNLAYLLSVRRERPAEALPLARRAHVLAPGNGTIGDTLGWIEHLLGNHERAVSLLTDAIRVAPGNAEIHVHLAAAHAALGRWSEARRALDAALALSPALAGRADVAALKTRVQEAGRGRGTGRTRPVG